MRLFKALFFSAFSVFLIYRTAELVRQLMSSGPENYSFFETLILALIVNLFITGVFALPGFAMPTSRLLPDRFYLIIDPALLKKLYQKLGVKHFRLALMLVYWGHKKNRKKYFDGTRSGFKNLIYQSRQSEFGHLASGVIVMLVAFFLATQGYWLLFLMTNLINVVGNGYPVILQRHHRVRIERLLA